MTEHAAADNAAADASSESPQPEETAPGSGLDASAGGTGGATDAAVGEPAGPRAQEEDDDSVQSAAELGASASTRRRLRQAGQENLGTWFEAEADFAGPTSFGGGHAVGGDVNYFYYSDAAARRAGTNAGPIFPGLLARIGETYVPCASDTATEEALQATRIAILRGARGAGRRTSALRLLAKLVGDGVHELGASAVLGPPDNVELQEGTGYLAEGDAGSVFAYRQMAAWPAKLSEKNAYLIITVPADAAVNADVAEHFLIDHIPPDGPAIVRAHLTADSERAAEAARLLEEPGVVSCAVSPAAAADLAARLLVKVHDDLPTADLAALTRAVRGREARRMLGHERPTTQRDRISLLCRRALLLSIAVFVGMPYADTILAAEGLAEALIAIEIPDPKDADRELFVRWRDLFATEPGIAAEELMRADRWGLDVVRHIRFSDPQLHGVMLEEIWERYDAVRSPLLGWLADLALRAQDEAVRVRAAQVVGRFAIRDFGHVCHRLIDGWANSVNPRHRETAATALEAAATGRQTHVWELLRDWCDGGSQHRQLTAILALGTTIGDSDASGTLARLRRLTQRSAGGQGRSVAEAVRRSLIDLMSGPHQWTVVRTLREWANGEDIRLSALARRCAPSLAHLTDSGDRSSFLATLSGQPTLRRDAVSLFAAALADPETRQETWYALERLTVMAAKDPRQIDALGELLHDLQLSPEADSDRLFFYLRVWMRRNGELRTAITDAASRAPA